MSHTPHHSPQRSDTPLRWRASGRVLGWQLAAVLAVAAAGGAWWYLHPRASDAGAPGAAPGASAAGAAAAGGARRFGGGAGGVQPVSVRAARQQDIRVMVNAIGSLTASNTAVVRAQVSGILQSIQFQEGQQVKAGQVLAQIDPRAFAATAAQAASAVASAHAAPAHGPPSPGGCAERHLLEQELPPTGAPLSYLNWPVGPGE